MRKTALPTIALTLALGAAGTAWAADVQEILKKGGCLACHSVDKKIVGPAYKDVAAKYKGQDRAVVAAKLAEIVRKGGSGVFGPIPMPPNPPSKISDAELKEVVDFILKQ